MDDVRRARRIEVGVYLFTALALIVLGVFLTSKILNWIVGPAFVVAMVTTLTPLALKVAGVRDPDVRRDPAGREERTG
jgi:Kef-type K+ transport system membrane component KefB